ncbi:MAG TPA: SGNH/GDSL hydrolase family protein [Terriglobia bacterium]|nr:SGNH/GDSL hydrolase family protein [Terriglobia bacterium]
MRRTLTLTLAIGLLVAWPVSSLADSISQLVVFGDSLSDTGNVYIGTGGATPAPPFYTAGLYTDGPDSFPSTPGPQGVWVQQLAGMLGVPSPTPSLALGTDYAFGGALTGHDPGFPGPGIEPFVGDQLNLYLTGHPLGVPSNALYVFWAGANDIFTGLNTPQQAATNLAANINTLYADGGRDFLWLDMPPLGETPDGLALGSVVSGELNLASQAYNAAWSSSISVLEATDPGIKIVGVDVYGLVDSMLADPSAYGFVNATDKAQSQNVDPNTYLYWDGVHPTTEGHYQVAKLAYQDLTTPELPASMLLGTALLVGLVVLGRRRCASA